MAKGAQNLSDSELVALLLSTGTTRHSVLALSKILLKYYPLPSLANITITQLMRIAGIGMTKAARLMAALELESRVFAPASLIKTVILTTDDAVHQVKDIAVKKQEYVQVLYLNARHELIGKETVGIGSLNATLIEPKEILHPALTTPCTTLILAHNHPSNDCTPSREDIDFTKRIKIAAEIMGLVLTDHLIVSSSGYFSFREASLLK